MLAASFVGFLIARISSGFKKNNIIQTILTFIFIIFCFSIRYIIEAVLRNNQVEATLDTISEMMDNAARVYPPAGWFSQAVTKPSILGFLLLVSVSAALFLVLFDVVGKSYRNINSSIKSHAAAKKYKMTTQKKRSVVQAIAFKEFKRMIGSTTYFTQCGLGEVLAALLGILTLIIGFDKIVAIVTQNAPYDPSILQPAIPFIIYFFVGMLATTACSLSLEGKNYWIVQSLPIEKKTLYQGKMLYNMYLTVPFMLFGILCFCISAGVPVLNALLYLILGVVLCAFSTTWGCVCGIKHMRLDWENEIEIIKQGSATAIYMLPNMFVVMALSVLVVFLGFNVDHKLLTFIFILITSVLTGLSYLKVMKLAK
jgi:ABC-2 type transport system permease protein